MALPTLKYVDWRVREDGSIRPRFKTGPHLRRLKVEDCDLKDAAGAWYTVEEVVSWWREKMDAIAQLRSGNVTPRKRKRSEFTVRDLFDGWFDTPRFKGQVVEEGKRRRKPLAAATVQDYKRKSDWLCALDDGKIADAPPAALSAVAAQGIFDRVEEIAGLDMARGVSAVASSCWSWARRRGKGGVKVNPWLDLERPMPDPRVATWEDFELAHFAKACAIPLYEGRGRNQHNRKGQQLVTRLEIADCVWLGVFTGQRQNDRLLLVDEGRDDHGRRVFRQTKTGAIVAVREVPQLADRLTEAMRRRKVVKPAGNYVVIDEQNGERMSGNKYRKLFGHRRRAAAFGVVQIDGDTIIADKLNADQRARVKRGEGVWLLQPCPPRRHVGEGDTIQKFTDLRDQDTRDTCVTWLARASSTPQEIANVSGHSYASIHTILKHYLARHPDMSDAAIGKLVAWMEKEGVAV